MKHQKKYVQKRKQPRINKHIQFKIRINGSTVVAEIINLSCIGAYCRINEHISLMTKLKILLPLFYGDQEKGTEYIEFYGVVTRVEQVLSEDNVSNIYNIAIFFNEIDKPEKEKIARFVERHIVYGHKKEDFTE